MTGPVSLEEEMIVAARDGRWRTCGVDSIQNEARKLLGVESKDWSRFSVQRWKESRFRMRWMMRMMVLS